MFAAHHQPGTGTNIYDPVANLCAGMNYLMGRYHVARDGSNLSAVGQLTRTTMRRGTETMSMDQLVRMSGALMGMARDCSAAVDCPAIRGRCWRCYQAVRGRGRARR